MRSFCAPPALHQVTWWGLWRILLKEYGIIYPFSLVWAFRSFSDPSILIYATFCGIYCELMKCRNGGYNHHQLDYQEEADYSGKPSHDSHRPHPPTLPRPSVHIQHDTHTQNRTWSFSTCWPLAVFFFFCTSSILLFKLPSWSTWNLLCGKGAS